MEEIELGSKLVKTIPSKKPSKRDPLKRRVSEKRYRNSTKGRETRQKWKNSPEGKEALQRYSESAKRKATYGKSRLKRKYGPGIFAFISERTKLQNGRCAICGIEDKLVVDHNHQTGELRGLLCQHCNKLLGFSKENPAILVAAVAYLFNLARSNELDYKTDLKISENATTLLKATLEKELKNETGN